ncbi:MAG: MoaD/ThiS family protein [Sedimenticola sp.]
MKINLELYASLMRLLPPGDSRHHRTMEVREGITAQGFIEHLGISDEEAHILLVNGHFVCGEERLSRALVEGETISIWPPVAGG